MDPENKRLVYDDAKGEGASVGEEGDDNRSSPGKDLVAATTIAAFSLFIMFLAVRMPNPGSVYTHPGLLPFLIGLSLLFMAVGLGIRAIREGGAKDLLQAPGRGVRVFFGNKENHRTLLLIGIIIGYVVGVDLVAFDLRLPLGFFVFRFSSFELISIITLSVILRIFWRATPARCFLVSAFWAIALASVFRYGFHILLPGLG